MAGEKISLFSALWKSSAIFALFEFFVKIQGATRMAFSTSEKDRVFLTLAAIWKHFESK